MDANQNALDSAKNYKLHLSPNIPVKDFWSVILDGSQTRSMIQTDQQFPSVGSQTKGLLVNADGPIDVWFGPKALPGKEKNWAADHSRQNLEHDSATVWSARAFVREDLAAGRDRNPAVTCRRRPMVGASNDCLQRADRMHERWRCACCLCAE